MRLSFNKKPLEIICSERLSNRRKQYSKNIPCSTLIKKDVSIQVQYQQFLLYHLYHHFVSRDSNLKLWLCSPLFNRQFKIFNKLRPNCSTLLFLLLSLGPLSLSLRRHRQWYPQQSSHTQTKTLFFDPLKFDIKCSDLNATESLNQLTAKGSSDFCHLLLKLVAVMRNWNAVDECAW